jgi:copper chaperone CopZ
MNWFISSVAVVALLSSTSGAWADSIPMVRLKIDGVHTDEDGQAVGKSLMQVPNAKVATFPSAKDPTMLVGGVRGATFDVGDLAAAGAQVKTPNRDKGAPSATLLLRYKLSGTDVESEDALAASVEKALAQVKGVDAKKSKLDSRQKRLAVKLDDRGGAKLAEIKAAFPNLTFPVE